MSLVLAIEPDGSQADVLRQIVRGRAGAELVLVSSSYAATVALNQQVPDLLLFGRAVTERQREGIRAHLRSLSDAPVQTLAIPQFRKAAIERSGGFFAFGRKPNAAAVDGGDPDVFAEQVIACVVLADSMRETMPAPAAEEMAPPADPPAEAGSEELAWGEISLPAAGEPPPIENEAPAFDENDFHLGLPGGFVVPPVTAPALEDLQDAESLVLDLEPEPEPEPEPWFADVSVEAATMGPPSAAAPEDPFDVGGVELGDALDALSEDEAAAGVLASAPAAAARELPAPGARDGEWTREDAIDPEVHAAEIALVQAQAEARLAAALERVRAEAADERLREVIRIEDEAARHIEAAVSQARAAAQADARAEMAAELARVRREADDRLAAELERMRLAADVQHIERLERSKAEAARHDEARLAATQADAMSARAAAMDDARAAAEAAAADALHAEVARVRAEMEARLEAELAKARAEAERRTAIEVDAVRAEAAKLLQTAEAEARAAAHAVMARDMADAPAGTTGPQPRPRHSGNGRRIAMAIAASVMVVATAGSLLLAFKSRAAAGVSAAAAAGAGGSSAPSAASGSNSPSSASSAAPAAEAEAAAGAGVGFLSIYSRIPLEIVAGGRRIGSSDNGQLVVPAGSYAVQLSNDHFGFQDAVTLTVRPGEHTIHAVTLPARTLQLITAAGAGGS